LDIFFWFCHLPHMFGWVKRMGTWLRQRIIVKNAYKPWFNMKDTGHGQDMLIMRNVERIPFFISRSNQSTSENETFKPDPAIIPSLISECWRQEFHSHSNGQRHHHLLHSTGHFVDDLTVRMMWWMKRCRIGCHLHLHWLTLAPCAKHRRSQILHHC